MASGCYVYAILARETVLPPGLVGFGGATLSTVPCGALAAATSPHDPGEPHPTAESVLRHEAIVEALRQMGPALPVRFGTVLPNEGAVADALADRYDVLVADLARLGDKVEFGLTVLWDRPIGNDDEPRDDRSPISREVTEAAGPGARYLRARLDEHRREAAARDRAKALAGDLDRALGSHTLERRCTILATSRLAVRAAYLLDPSRVRPFQETFQAIRRGHPDLRFLLSGPWPPYSFVSAAETEEGSAIGGRLRDVDRQLSTLR